MSVDKLEQSLRFAATSVITRILEDKVLIDLRTASETEETEILRILSQVT
jgi:hypothetical protein